MEDQGISASEIVILKIQGNTLRCNRSMLINNSDYFRAMFEGNFVESSKNTITINGVDIDAMTIILKLLWDIEYEIDENLLLSVLQASCMLQFLTIKEKCIKDVQESLSDQNSLRIWFVTEPLDIKEVYLRAKVIALMNFMKIKDADEYFLELNLTEIITYLGSINLQCTNEINVFKAILKWYEKSDEKRSEIALKLLHCIDHNGLTIRELAEILQISSNSFDSDVVEVLKCVYQQKSNMNFVGFNETCIQIANSLLKSKSRNLQGYPCILFDNLTVNSATNSPNTTVCLKDKFKRKRKYQVLSNEVPKSDMCLGFFEDNTFKLKKLLHVTQQKYLNLDGFRIAGHKDRVYMYGGEFLIGKGDWNCIVMCYILTQNIDTSAPHYNYRLPYARRHFDTCVCDNYLYIIGGTGPFRVIQENLFWFSFHHERWSKERKLPCSGRQTKCCEFNDKLFLLNINNRCGYFFYHEENNWIRVSISDNDNVLPAYSQTLCLFSYKNSLYIKEKKLFQLNIRPREQDDELIIVNQVDLPEPSNGIYQTEAVLCNKILYSLNKKRCDETNQEIISFEAFNIETLETFQKFEKNAEDVFDVDGESWKFRPSLNIFSVFHPDAVVGNDMVNDLLLC